MFAWGFWERRNSRLAGVFAALALLSGSLLWEGLLGTLLTWAILQLVERLMGWKTEFSPDYRKDFLSANGCLPCGLPLALCSSAVLSSFYPPMAWVPWLSSLPEYLSGWVHPPQVSGGMMFFSLFAYQPLAVILAVITIVRGWKDSSRRVVRLSLWMFVALLLALVYPSHQVSDLVWMLIPLWSLAALELARVVDVLPEERRQVIGVAGLTIFILLFVWLQFLALTVLPVATSQFTDRVWLLFGSMALPGHLHFACGGGLVGS